MRKYDGLVIHQNFDNEGIIEVVEKDGVRSLHFGSVSKQSSIRLSNKNELELIYAQTMMAWMLFKPTFDNALIIGLGGGSIPKYLLHHFPDSRIKVIEYRNSVIKIARSHFFLPRDPRLKIRHADGIHFIRHQAYNPTEKYSLLMIDAFDHEGLAKEICNLAFFDACHALLKDDGVLAINLWGNEKEQFSQIAAWLGNVFNWRLVFIPVKDRGNIIGLAFAKNVPMINIKTLRNHAVQLEQKFQLNFSGFLKDIRKHNNLSLRNVIKK